MFGGECCGVVVYPGCGFVKPVGVVGGGGFGVVYVMGVSLCLGLCLGFGCGSVMMGVTLEIGCVCLTM